MPRPPRWHVSIPHPDDHTLHVELSFEATGDETELHLPVWTPGSYLVREFSRYLGSLTVSDEHGRQVPIRRIAKGSWTVDAVEGTALVARYTAYCHELTVRTPHVDGTHAFFTGTNVLLRVAGAEEIGGTLQVTPPAGWSVFCPLDERDGAWVADDWDTIADTPIEVGPHRAHRFDVDGVPHRFVFWGDDAVEIDIERLEADTRALVRQNASVFGGELPYERYDFVFHITAKSRGGLEHLNSTVLATPWRYFDTEDGYREMLGLISHEHLHTWNVKRIRPAGLVPFDYQNENYTRALWVSEGFTSYLDDYHCLRAGVVDREWYLTSLGRSLTRLRNTPGRLAQSVADASFDAWIRLYRPDENTPNRTVSYYLKGAMVALLVDLHVRSATDGERSMADVMATLWDDWRETGAGFDEDGIADVVQRATGVELAEALTQWVDGTDELPLEAALRGHGLRVEHAEGKHPDLGLSVQRGHDICVSCIAPDGPAASAGVYAGDVLVAVAGRRLTSDSFDDTLATLHAGRSVALHLFRRDRLIEVSITPREPAPGAITVAIDDQAAADVVALRDGWLGAVSE